MKALTVRNPWAWHIIHGGKRIENRSRRTLYRGPLAVHAGAQPDKTAPGNLVRLTAPFGAVLGTVDLTGCHHWSECRGRITAGSLCTDWAMEDHWHWELANAVAFPEPIPAKGRLGLWDWEPGHG